MDDAANRAQHYKERGNGHFGAGRFEEAITSYTLAIEANPDSNLLVILWSNTSECHLRLSNYQKAMDAAENALKIDKNHEKSLIRYKKASNYVNLISLPKNLLQQFLENEEPNQNFLQFFKDQIHSTSSSILANTFASGLLKNKEQIPEELLSILRKISLNIGYLMILQKKHLPEALTWCDLSFSNLSDMDRLGHPFPLVRQVFINGNYQPMINLIKIQNKNGNIKELLNSTQKERIKIWKTPDNFNSVNTNPEKVKNELKESHRCWSQFWIQSESIENARVECALSFKKILSQVSANFPGNGKFKFKLICDDTPHSDSIQESWNKPGNMNYEEQQKSIQFFTLQMMQNSKINPIPRLPTLIDKNIIPGVNPLCSKIQTRPIFSVPFIKFIKVESLKKFGKFVPFEEIHEENFTEKCSFAVSYRFINQKSNESNFKRLLRILNQVSVDPEEGVFIDYCCIPSNDPFRRALILNNLHEVFTQAHVIFLLKKDYFLRGWCWMEFSEWLLSPFPNQAITDRVGLASSLNEISMHLFKKPIFLLDRPEVQSLSGIWMKSTSGKDMEEVERVSKVHGQYSMINSTGLYEISTRIVFKMESTLLIAENPPEAS